MGLTRGSEPQFPPSVMGVSRAHAPQSRAPGSSLLPAPSRPGEEAPILPSVQVGKRGAPERGGPLACGHAPGQSRAPLQTPSPPHFPDDGRDGEEEPGGGAAELAEGGRGHPQEAALFPELRFKEQDAKFPDIRLARWQPRSSAHLGGTGEQSAGQGPQPSPGPPGPS